MPGMEFFGAEERKEVQDVLETGILFRYNHDAQRNNIWKARSLEEEVRKYTGANYAHAVSSGSTAVATALAAAGIGYGHQVIVPPFTFIATIEAVLFVGAIPVFAEIDENLCLSAKGIEAALTPDTKAVLLVHMCGASANMDEIMEVCKKHNLVLVEDAGQALGAFYKGKSVGTFGKTGCYSFDFFKITTCGEGGVLVTDDENCYKLADCYSDHGHNHVGNNRGMEQHPILGFNFRIGELNAAVGLAQMRKLNKIRSAKKHNQQRLKELLSGVEGITFRPVPDPEGDSGTFLNFFMPTTEMAGQVFELITKNKVESCNYWYINMYHFINQWDHLKNLKTASPMAIHHLKPVQDYNNLQLPVSQNVIGRLISVGVKATWTDEQIVDLADNLKKIISTVINNK
ncbi:MAG: DegT/DnrJ/EryC1/StrS family aminotransferase [Bacteroidales bacterium]